MNERFTGIRRHRKQKTKRFVVISAACFLAILSHSMPAIAALKTYGDDNIYLNALYDPAYDPVGARIGGFTLYPSLSESIKFTDNVYATDRNTVSDSILVTRPSLSLRSDFVRHKLDLRTFAEKGNYRDYASENYFDYGATLDSRLDVTGNMALPLTFGYSKLHEDRETPDNNNLKPLVYKLTEATAGLVREGQQIAMKLLSGYKRFEYQNSHGTSGVIDTSDRNRDIYSLYSSIGVTPDAILAPYVYASYLDLKYQNNPVGLNRDSHELEGGIGAIINFSQITRASFNIGKKKRDFDDPSFDNIRTLTYGVNLVWEPREYLSLLLEGDRTIQEATFSGTSASINSVLRLSANYQFRQNIFLQPSLSFLERDYQGVNSGQVYTTTGRFDLVYKMNPNLWVATYYQFTGQDDKDNVAGIESFDRNMYGLSLKLQF